MGPMARASLARRRSSLGDAVAAMFAEGVGGGVVIWMVMF